MCSCFSFNTVRTRVGLPSDPAPPPETPPDPPTPPIPRSPLLLTAPRDRSPLSFRVDVVMQVSELSECESLLFARLCRPLLDLWLLMLLLLIGRKETVPLLLLLLWLWCSLLASKSINDELVWLLWW